MLRTTALALFVLVTLLTCALDSARAQEAEPSAPSCKDCGSNGVRACSEHKRDLADLESAVRACSVAQSCRRCAGALQVDCKGCLNPRAEEGLRRRAALAAQFVAERRDKVGAHAVEPDEVFYLATEHCDLSFSFAPMTIDRRKVDTHRLMHLYGARIEDLHRRFVEVFGLGAADFPVPADDVSPRLGVHMFEDARDQRELAPRLTGIGSQGTGVKMMGSFLAYSVWHDPKTLRDDADVHRAIRHNVTHLLLSSLVPTVWIGNRGHGWIDEGVAHFFEIDVDGRCANFCYEEVGVAPGANWKGGRWRVGLRQLVETGQLRRFTELYEKNSDQLDLEAHAHAYGWVDFLI
ncbi:MAG: hypothetical protein ACO4CT_12765, partial [Planctomycetota bacterium]